MVLIGQLKFVLIYSYFWKYGNTLEIDRVDDFRLHLTKKNKKEWLKLNVCIIWIFGLSVFLFRVKIKKWENLRVINALYHFF